MQPPDPSTIVKARVILARIRGACEDLSLGPIIMNDPWEVAGTVLAVPGWRDDQPACAPGLQWEDAMLMRSARAVILLGVLDVRNAWEVYTAGVAFHNLPTGLVLGLDGTAAASLRTALERSADPEEEPEEPPGPYYPPVVLERFGARRLVPVPTGKSASVFSSWGPGLGFEIKPDIAVGVYCMCCMCCGNCLVS